MKSGKKEFTDISSLFDAPNKFMHFLYNIINDIDDAIVIKDDQHRVFLVNDAAASLFKRDKKQMIGKTDFDFFPSEIAEIEWNDEEKVLNTGVPSITEKEILYDGSLRIFSIRKSLFTDDQTGNNFVISNIRDITDLKLSEIDLRNSEARFKILYDYAPDAYFLTDYRGNFLAGNNAAEELIGYSKDEFIGKNPFGLNIIPRILLYRMTKLLVKNISGKPGGPIDLLINRKDGSRVSVEIISKPFKSKNMDLILGLVRDVTHRKIAEDKIRLSEHKYKTIYELSPAGIVTVDMKGIILSANSAFINQSGYPKKQLLGQNILKHPLLSKANFKDPAVTFGLIKDGKLKQPVMIEWEQKDGSLRFAEANFAVMKDRNTPHAIQAVFRDTTARRKMENDLRKSKNRYQQLYNENPTMYFTINKAGVVLSVNKFGAEELGYTADELIGRSVLQVFYEEDIPDVKKQVEKLLLNPNQVGHWEFRKIKKDGTMIWVRENARAIIEDDEEPVILIVCENVTEIKKTQIEKEALLKKLGEQEKLVTMGHFTSAIAHEINNPLDVMMNEIYHLEKSNASDDKCLKTLKTQVIHMSQLLTGIMSYVRPVPLQLKEININTVINRAMEFLKESQKSEISINVKSKTSMLSVLGDEIGLEIVIKNVLLNALQAVKADGAIQITYINNKEGMLVLSIEDNGGGIEKKNLDSIFDAFFSSKRNRGGSGLGLTICKDIIEKHHGKIEVKSTQGKGTKVSILLPQYRDSNDV